MVHTCDTLHTCELHTPHVCSARSADGASGPSLLIRISVFVQGRCVCDSWTCDGYASQLCSAEMYAWDTDSQSIIGRWIEQIISKLHSLQHCTSSFPSRCPPPAPSSSSAVLLPHNSLPAPSTSATVFFRCRVPLATCFSGAVFLWRRLPPAPSSSALSSSGSIFLGQGRPLCTGSSALCRTDAKCVEVPALLAALVEILGSTFSVKINNIYLELVIFTTVDFADVKAFFFSCTFALIFSFSNCSLEHIKNSLFIYKV